MTDPAYDPYAGGDSAPAISWADAAVGAVHTLKVDGPAQVVQGKDYQTGEPAEWPAKGGKPAQPKMSVVYNGTDENGEERALWAVIRGSDMFAKLKDAQEAVSAGYRIKAGDTIKMKLSAREPRERGNPKNVFQVKIEPGAAPAPQDAFSDEPPF